MPSSGGCRFLDSLTGKNDNAAITPASLPMNERPILSIPRTTFETSIAIVSASAVVFMCLIVGVSWHGLPEQVPSHFGISGRPDAWSERPTLLILPVVGIVFWIALIVLTRIPHRFNYIVPISHETAARQYRSPGHPCRHSTLRSWPCLHTSHGKPSQPHGDHLRDRGRGLSRSCS
jgi:hypothetical protein